MSDLGKYLPMSRPSGHDESGVTNDWSGPLAAVVAQLAALLERLGPDALSRPSLRPGWAIGGTVRELAWHLQSARWQRMLDRVHRRLRLPTGVSTVDEAHAMSILRDWPREPQRHRSIADLSAAVVALYDVALSTGTPVTIDGVASGAVALTGSMRAPTPIRAVIRGRTLHASDAGWKIGRGPVLEGTAQAIVLFLFGRAGVP